MPQPKKYLLVGSTEAYSGKSATILGLAHQLQSRGIDLAYGKPLGTCSSESGDNQMDQDVRFLSSLLKLPPERVKPTLLSLNAETIEKRLLQQDTTDYHKLLVESDSTGESELVVLEGPGNLEEGSLFDLSLTQVARVIDARVLLVARFHSVLLVDALLAAGRRLGDRLLGVVINDIPSSQLDTARTQVQSFLEDRGIRVLGLLPSSELLRSVSVGEVAHNLNADVLCCADRLDLMLEGIQIGAMGVNSAVQYFTQARNMAIVTGGDRADIQLAALETAAHCLILTGHITPPPLVLSRAEEVEIPVLSVDLDTLQTVEQIEQTFGKVRLHDAIKVEYVRQMMAEHFDLDRLLDELDLKSAIASS
ncbi:phosphotransacetylase family protein [Oscillatoriales cyanobacterium LEGE 11467]|uniref:Phosphotransacetylase family protein n=1 Tax=Zarconia navalis LEGE 11467 TaxID=1828826 RepID=A0A928VW62_9CYAN|nr:phosphotransacetylase family protein [Zarconia navalis]MBE9039253.1 phosphotransacetylase family protein [Zarconia navalis LEGE 11467]